MKSIDKIAFPHTIGRERLALRYEQEVKGGDRFEFGKNWRRFLSGLTDQQVESAERSLKSMLQVEDLRDQRFLDVGSGSGLFSLAARRLGAEVHSFDYDPESVACTGELRVRHFPNDISWKIEAGSVLDNDYLRKLGEFDIVYCWGVLHHTGAMWQSLENVTDLVAEGGKLFIALYNDQGSKSKAWRKVKRFYCSGLAGKICASAVFVPYFTLGGFCRDLLRRRNPLDRYTEPRRLRGMSYLCDLLDWIGGYPFEVATPDTVVQFCGRRGFVLEKIVTCGDGLGNNQFVFIRK